jgi:hypothetical protein
MFWPREIWGQYASELEDFKDKHNRAAAVQCLNNMVSWVGSLRCLESQCLSGSCVKVKQLKASA